MTSAQAEEVYRLLDDLTAGDRELFFHHGDCVGADVAAAKIAHDLGWQIVTHPPLKDDLRAFFPASLSCTVHAPKEYLARNRDIVDAAGELIATPGTDGSRGTRYTIEYALSHNKRVHIVSPDGTVSLLPRSTR